MLRESGGFHLTLAAADARLRAPLSLSLAHTVESISMKTHASGTASRKIAVISSFFWIVIGAILLGVVGSTEWRFLAGSLGMAAFVWHLLFAVFLVGRPVPPAPVFPDSLDQAGAVLEALDRELGFFRRRAGQVLFYGMLAEALILGGGHALRYTEMWNWQSFVVNVVFFAAIAGVGIVLGSEYRARIHRLKDSRAKLVSHLGCHHLFPSPDQRLVSEIQVLYVILTLMSSIGIIFTWAKAFFGDQAP